MGRAEQGWRGGEEGKWRGDPVRLVTVEVDGHTLQIVTDLDIEAELIALIYPVTVGRGNIFSSFEW